MVFGRHVGVLPQFVMCSQLLWLWLFGDYLQIVEEIVAELRTIDAHVSVFSVKEVVFGEIGSSQDDSIIKYIDLLVVHSQHLS